MSYLNRFFDQTFDPSNSSSATPAGHDPSNQLTRRQSPEFNPTSAVRPSKNSNIKPAEGFRNDTYVDETTGAKIPVIMASVSKEKLFQTFMRLIQRLGSVVDVVIESSHDSNSNGHVDLYREHIDMPVLTSVLWEYEDLLLNDGCTGIAVLNPEIPQEIQFEEHKLLICYGSPLEPYEFILDGAGVGEQPEIRFITEGEHVHSSSNSYARQFEQLRTDLGLDGSTDRDADRNNEGYGDFGDYGDSAGGLM
jgi:hypothetical protein